MMQKRSLSVILFSDLVGFSALASTNEAKALQLVDLNRQHQKPIIRKYGTFIKEMGDGMMAKFDSVVSAIACAFEIQSTLPDALNEKIRIGIHLGEVTEEQGDVFGDGVNIASRIESIAEPGSIYISDSVYNSIKSRRDIDTEFIGEKELKNIADPVKCYRVNHVDDALLKSEKTPFITHKLVVLVIIAVIIASGIWIFTKRNKKDSSPTVIVLPFEQVEGDSVDIILEKGITNELISTLGKNEKITVLNSKTSLKYLGSLNPFQQASSDLQQADYFVLGEYSKNSNNIELNVRLIDQKRNELWKNSYRKDEVFLPTIIGTLVIDISNALNQDLDSSIKTSLVEIQNVDPETYALYLKGMNIIYDWNMQTLANGISYLQEAVDQNPADSKAWAGLAEGYVWQGHIPTGPPDAWNKAKAAAIRAIQLDSTNAEAWAALAHTKTYFEYDFDGAKICYDKANELNPNMAWNHYHYAWHLYLLDSIDKAIEEHKIAQNLDPFAPFHTFWLGGLYMFKGELNEAKKEFYKSLKIDPNNDTAWGLLANVYNREENMDSTQYCLQKSLELNPFQRYLSHLFLTFRNGDTKEAQALEKEIEAMPLNSFTAYLRSLVYKETGNADGFFEAVDYKPRNAFIPWVVRRGVRNEVILNDPRYIETLKDLNLPPPTRFDDSLF